MTIGNLLAITEQHITRVQPENCSQVGPAAQTTSATNVDHPMDPLDMMGAAEAVGGNRSGY